MKKLVAFVLMLSLGMFSVIGCTKPDKPKNDPKKPAAGADKGGAAAVKTPEKGGAGEKK